MIKEFLPRTLFARSLLILVTPIVLLQIITAYIFLDRHWERITSRLAFAVASELAVIANVIEQDPSTEQMRFIQSNVAERLDFQMTFLPGQKLETEDLNGSYNFWREIWLKSLKKELEGSIQRPFFVHPNIQYKTFRIDIEIAQGLLRFDVAERRLFSSTSYIFLLWMFGSSILLIVIAVLFMRNQIRPIRRLAVAAERFGKGRGIGDFKPTGAREVRRAAQSFMDMQQRITRQIEQRTMMLAGISHDLRTPITRLKLQLAMMQGDEVEAMKNDLNDMEIMMNGYLDFVRENSAEPFEEVDLQALVNKLIADQFKAVDVDAYLSVIVQPSSLERCLANIINNAARYADQIWVLARKEGDKIILTIEDNGHGIPEENYEDVLKPFYRLDQARDVSGGSVGLGLSIAQDIVHSHGGEMTLSASEHGGLKVILVLPR